MARRLRGLWWSRSPRVHAHFSTSILLLCCAVPTPRSQSKDVCSGKVLPLSTWPLLQPQPVLPHSVVLPGVLGWASQHSLVGPAAIQCSVSGTHKPVLIFWASAPPQQGPQNVKATCGSKEITNEINSLLPISRQCAATSWQERIEHMYSVLCRTNVFTKNIPSPPQPPSPSFPQVIADHDVTWNGRSLGSVQPSCPLPVPSGTLAHPQPMVWGAAETPHAGPALLRDSQSLGLGPTPLQPRVPSTAAQGLLWAKATPAQPQPGQGGSGGSSHLCHYMIP